MWLLPDNILSLNLITRNCKVIIIEDRLGNEHRFLARSVKT